MWGSCVWLCAPVRSSSRSSSRYSHTQLTHTQLSDTQLAHTKFAHTHRTLFTHNSLTHNSLTHLSHTHNLPTHNLLTHNLLTYSSLTHTQLSHIQLSHTQLSHIQLSSHTTLFTHNSLDTQLSYTQLSHTELSQTLCVRRGTCGPGLALVAHLVLGDAAPFCVAGVALGDIDLHSVWQAWHLVTSTFILCGRGGTFGTRLALVARLVPADAAPCCVAGVALLQFVWQAWHLVTSTVSGTCGTGLPLVERLVMPLHFVWQAWRLATSTFILCGRRCAW